MKKMHIYVEMLGDSDADKQVILLANSLSSYFDITIISFSNIACDMVINKKIKQLELNIKNKTYLDNIRLRNSISKLEKDNGVDIVIVCSLKGVRVLGSIFSDSTKIYWRLDDAENSEVMQKYLNHFQKIVFLSETEKEKFKSTNIESVVIPPSITSIPLDFEYTYNKNIIYMGSLDNELNFKRLIDIMLILKREDEDIKLSIIGDSQYRLEMMNYCKHHNLQNNIIFYGNLDNDEIDYELKRVSLILNFDNNIRNSIRLIEAMNYGIPVISQYSEALKNIIENDINGYLVNGAPDDYVDKILSIYSSSEALDNMRQCARETSLFYEINSIKGEWLKIL